MPAPAPRAPRAKLRDEHIGSRKDWGAYIDLTSRLHRRTAEQAEEYLVRIRARLAQALRQRP